MRILFLTSAHNSLSQRLEIELMELGHQVIVTIASDDRTMVRAVEEHRPDLIIAPMLTTAIPQSIWSAHTCLIVHPGIVGDRGPSSLDWALMKGEKTWGVTILQAAAEFDAGSIWATRTFPLGDQPVSKSNLYRNEVTEAAVQGVIEAVTKFQSGTFQPEPLDYNRPDVRGCLRPPMRQSDRAIDWGEDTTAEIVRKIRAADSAPGVLDTIYGRHYYLYGAHAEDRIQGAPGQILAQRHGAICRGTVDGAVWITHLKARDEEDLCGLALLHKVQGGCELCEADLCAASDIKLPAVQALGAAGRRLPSSDLPIHAPRDHQTFREITYTERDGIGMIVFDFYNGAMSTQQCYRLRNAILFARTRPTRVIVLLGGRDFFSNGIHLNVIEVAADPALESWRNINAIDDVVHEILTTMSHLVIAGLRGNAGAGGAMLALAADYVYARDGVVFNPHYKTMGGLYGSEYWTYSLPRRVGAAKSTALTEKCRPVGSKEAKMSGFIDDSFGSDVSAFELILAERAHELSAREDFWQLLRSKHERRLADERAKPLAHYRAEELAHMRANFFGRDPAYHLARQNFVRKGKPPSRARHPEKDLTTLCG